MRSRLPAIGAALAAAIALLFYMWATGDVYERLPHIEDDFSNLWAAHVFAQGQAALRTPPDKNSFLVPFVVDFNGLRFSKYPPGWPAALSVGVRFGADWLVNPILAALAVWLTFRLGSKIAGPWIGLLAAVLLVISPMAVMISASLLSHSLSLFLSLAFVLAWIDLFLAAQTSTADPPRPAMLVPVAGASLGLLALTRPLTAIGVALPFAVHGLWILLRGRTSDRRHLVGLAGLAMAIAALLPVWQRSLTGNPWLNLYTLWWPYDRLGFGPGIGVTSTGHNLHLAYSNARFSLRAGVHDLFGWPYLSWIFLPFGLVSLRKNLRAWLGFATFPGLILAYSFYWIGSWLYGPRYYYEALPGLAVMSAAGIFRIGGWSIRTGFQPGLRRRAMAALLAGLVAVDLFFYLPARLGGMRQLYSISRAAMAPIETADLGRALIVVHPEHRWTEYGALLTLSPPFSSTDMTLLAIFLGGDQDAQLARDFPDRILYHYYTSDPSMFYRISR
ncbi:MAG TPA: hypothetical protein VJK02_16660 [Anaerolineales bacterium]|nr:hypothetical protein [Anaerolineales bacterium]